MSLSPLPAFTTVHGWTNALHDWPSHLRARWTAATAIARTRIQVAVLVVVVVVGYRYSLESLLQTAGFDTPLAYVGLVPLIAGALAYGLRTPTRPELAIHDRQLDYIIGVPLIAIALCINEFLPARQSVLFWVRRMDLISMPFFVAGAVTLLFGTRVLWRQKLAICYLFLAWPWPYTNILLGTLNGFTNTTVSALTWALKILHFAAPVAAANGETGLFSIVHHGVSFPVSVVSACSGVDGMVGFFLVGAAFTAVVRGPRLRKLAWLAVGLVLLWSTNLARLLLIFWAGQHFGEHLALSILHPVAGLIIFNIGVVLMVLLLKPFGLRLGGQKTAESTAVSGPSKPGFRKAPPIFVAAGLLAVVAMVLTVNQTNLRSYNLVAGAAGDPKLSSFLAQPAAPVGWQPEFDTEYFQNKSLFGESSRWFRYSYYDKGGGDLSSPLPVTADVINAAGVSDFGAYGVEACYNFHGYTLRDIARVSLGDGIAGQTLSFANTSGADWSIVYWIWPVKTGTQTRYERVILYLQNTDLGQVKVRGTVPGIKGLQGALSGTNLVDQRLTENRAFLVAFAREIIVGQAQIKETLANIGELKPPLLAPIPVLAAPPATGKTSPAVAPAKLTGELLKKLLQQQQRSNN